VELDGVGAGEKKLAVATNLPLSCGSRQRSQVKGWSTVPGSTLHGGERGAGGEHSEAGRSAGGCGGADRHQGLPSFLRRAKEENVACELLVDSAPRSTLDRRCTRKKSKQDGGAVRRTSRSTNAEEISTTKNLPGFLLGEELESLGLTLQEEDRGAGGVHCEAGRQAGRSRREETGSERDREALPSNNSKHPRVRFFRGVTGATRSPCKFFLDQGSNAGGGSRNCGECTVRLEERLGTAGERRLGASAIARSFRPTTPSIRGLGF